MNHQEGLEDTNQNGMSNHTEGAENVTEETFQQPIGDAGMNVENNTDQLSKKKRKKVFKNLAKAISFIFFPLLIPIYGTFMLFNMKLFTYYPIQYVHAAKTTIYIFGIILPCLSFIILKLFKAISDVRVPRRSGYCPTSASHFAISIAHTYYSATQCLCGSSTSSCAYHSLSLWSRSSPSSGESADTPLAWV